MNQLSAANKVSSNIRKKLGGLLAVMALLAVSMLMFASPASACDDHHQQPGWGGGYYANGGYAEGSSGGINWGWTLYYW